MSIVYCSAPNNICEAIPLDNSSNTSVLALLYITIHLCVDYRKLNSITIMNVFPLPHIDETLWVVHSSNVFTSFDMTQGYLQLAMAEDDIKKTTFSAGSSGLYEFTHVPFGL